MRAASLTVSVPGPTSSGSVVRVVWTGAADGDHGIAVPSHELDERRRVLIGDRPCTWLRQVHGTSVCIVDPTDPPAVHAGTEADASVTAASDAVLSVVTADCAPIALWSDDGVIAAVHAGWRGLADGVITRAVASVRERSTADGVVRAALGPCIGPECYEFGAGDLERVVTRVGVAARGRTAAGSPALDLPAAIEAQLGSLGVTLDRSRWSCTACSSGWFSWRARRDDARQAMYVWRSAS